MLVHLSLICGTSKSGWKEENVSFKMDSKRVIENSYYTICLLKCEDKF